jgi:hypothetical protein
MHESADAVLIKVFGSVGKTIWTSLKSGKLVFWVRSNGRTGNDPSPDPDKMHPHHGMPTIPECPLSLYMTALHPAGASGYWF